MKGILLTLTMAALLVLIISLGPVAIGMTIVGCIILGVLIGITS